MLQYLGYFVAIFIGLSLGIMGGGVFPKNMLVLVAFVVLMVVAAVSMIRSQQAEEVLDHEPGHRAPPNYPLILGTYLARFIPGVKLKPAFGWFTLAMGTFILVPEQTFH